MNTYRFPPLTEFLIDQIAFAMEDQNTESLLDLKQGAVITDDERSFLDEDEREDPHRFIELPEWTSADGFRLMEEYAEGVRNDAIRERLFFALNRGKGVFRAFKD
ncbi:MAG TPA: GNAT family N-acetyltransferase, partial [Sphaerochaeta sp.]|nr:GNAT family N-acetyltransferase [Sphaerochaeta sp.]